MTPDEINEALALKAIRQSRGFAALEAHLRRRYEDLFRQWRESERPGQEAPSTFTPEYCRGAADVLESLVPDIDHRIIAAESAAADDERKEAAVANERLGHGDLVL